MWAFLREAIGCVGIAADRAAAGIRKTSYKNLHLKLCCGLSEIEIDRSDK